MRETVTETVTMTAEPSYLFPLYSYQELQDAIDWAPFVLVEAGQFVAPPRPMDTIDGIADRMRSAAFAEKQAILAFRWAADHFEDASLDLREAWRELAFAEEKHMNWLLVRMKELGFEVISKPVSDRLWRSLIACTSAKEFAFFMANAEERGQKAGMRFYEFLRNKDAVTAEIFLKIAQEETEHIALAKRFFPDGYERKTTSKGP